jgi:hypothetical protein
MTQLDVIRMIGDVLTDIDTAIGSLDPNDPNEQKLHDLRIMLDDRQRQLSRAAFDDNSNNFQIASQQLDQVNQQIQGTITNIGNMVTTIANITRFLNVVTSLMTTVAAL